MTALSLVLAVALAMPEATSAKHKRPKRRTSLAGFVQPDAFTPPSAFTCTWNEADPIHDYECKADSATGSPTFRLTKRDPETLPHALEANAEYYDLNGDGTPDGDIEGWDAAPALAHPDTAPVFSCSGPDGSSDATQYQCRFTFFGYTHEFAVSEIVSVVYADDVFETEQWFVPCDAPPAPCVALDLAPPDTTITAGPAGTVASRDADLAFASSESGSSFECRIDSGSWEHCFSPKRYSALLDGDHRFEVRASDPGGNADPTPATRDWGVDATGPLMMIGKRKVRLSRRGVARLRISCPGSEESGLCSGRLTLKTTKRLRHGKKVFLGGKRFAITARESARIAVKLSKRNRRLVARLGRLRVRATARASDPLGNIALNSRILIMTAPRG